MLKKTVLEYNNRTVSLHSINVNIISISFIVKNMVLNKRSNFKEASNIKIST